MIPVEAFSELLQVLYSVPLQQELWQEFLTRLCQYTGSNLGVFISADTTSGLAVLAAAGGQGVREVVSKYNQHFAQSDPFRTAIVRRSRTQNPVAVYTADELIPPPGLFTTAIYQGLLCPASLRYGVITILACTVRRLDAISFWRTPEEGPISTDSRRLLEFLIPHVQMALEFRRVLGVTTQRLASAEAMANASPTPTFVLNRNATVKHWNTAAASLVQNGDGLTLIDGRLTPCDSETRSTLSKLLINVALPSFSISETHPSHFLSIPRLTGRRPFQLIATPLPKTHCERSRGDLLVLVTDPEKPPNLPDDALRALYDLTPAETEVANGLLMGYSPHEIACLRRVSSSTVRQQVKSMLNKTGTGRQSDMVRLFMTLPQVPAETM